MKNILKFDNLNRKIQECSIWAANCIKFRRIYVEAVVEAVEAVVDSVEAVVDSVVAVVSEDEAVVVASVAVEPDDAVVAEKVNLI